MFNLQSSYDYRYERKFDLMGRDPRDLQTVLRLHPMILRETYPPRYVNNIYLDTAGFRHLIDHIEGASQRYKVRVRWYGESRGSVEKPVLEFKVRNGLVGCKPQFPMDSFNFQSSYTAHDMSAHVNRSQLPCAVRSTLSGLRPVLANRYRRKYFESADKRFRLTLDYEMTYFDPCRPSQSSDVPYADRELTIIELKYSANLGEQFTPVRLPFRLSKFSKYVRGMQYLQLHH